MLSFYYRYLAAAEPLTDVVFGPEVRIFVSLRLLIFSDLVHMNQALHKWYLYEIVTLSRTGRPCSAMDALCSYVILTRASIDVSTCGRRQQKLGSRKESAQRVRPTQSFSEMAD